MIIIEEPWVLYLNAVGYVRGDGGGQRVGGEEILFFSAVCL